jgi:hypothetical protein
MVARERGAGPLGRARETLSRVSVIGRTGRENTFGGPPRRPSECRHSADLGDRRRGLISNSAANKSGNSGVHGSDGTPNSRNCSRHHNSHSHNSHRGKARRSGEPPTNCDICADSGGANTSRRDAICVHTTRDATLAHTSRDAICVHTSRPGASRLCQRSEEHGRTARRGGRYVLPIRRVGQRNLVVRQIRRQTVAQSHHVRRDGTAPDLSRSHRPPQYRQPTELDAQIPTKPRLQAWHSEG